MLVGRVELRRGQPLLCARRWWWAPGCVAIGADERLPVEHVDVSCAGQGGHVEVLRWAREHECPWSELTTAFAAAGGHRAAVGEEHGCPCNSATCRSVCRVPGGAEVGAGVCLPEGLSDACIHRYARVPGDAPVAG